MVLVGARVRGGDGRIGWRGGGGGDCADGTAPHPFSWSEIGANFAKVSPKLGRCGDETVSRNIAVNERNSGLP